LNRKHARALIDTGAFYNCINVDFAKRLHLSISTDTPHELPQLYDADDNPLHVIGTVTADVSIQGFVCTVYFMVIDGLHHNV